MSFFKDFKDDLSVAVNELLPGEEPGQEEETEESSELMVNTFEGELDIESELSKLDGFLKPVDKAAEPRKNQIEPEEPVLEPKPQARQPVRQPARAAAKAMSKPAPKQTPKPVPKAQEPALAPLQDVSDSEASLDMALGQLGSMLDLEEKKAARPRSGMQLQTDPRPQREMPVRGMQGQSRDLAMNTTVKEEVPMNEEMAMDSTLTMEDELSSATPEVSDEVSIITEGTTIRGNLAATGSFSISGRVEGNVQCNGKLEITGTIKGNSSSSEVFSDAAKIEGEIVSTGTVKIGLGSVVVGNITATSAVVAGAVKGDIDVQGPVVVDTSAVIVGNIKSRSVQINNGAVIEGFCSQCYADIDVDSLFGENKKGK